MDAFMMDLFRQEAETHAQELQTGLLGLEESPRDKALLEKLMRASHSIKGAARIVNLELISGLAHAMEDSFVAAQKGALEVTAQVIDHLLEGKDLIAELGRAAEMEKWIAEKSARIVAATNRLRELGAGAVAKGREARVVERPEEPAEVREPEPVGREVGSGPGKEVAGGETNSKGDAGGRKEAPAKETKRRSRPVETEPPATESAWKSDDYVRLSAENINRMMQLSAEFLVESRRIGPLNGALLEVKREQLASIAEIERLENEFAESGGEAIHVKVAPLKNQMRKVQYQLEQEMGYLEALTRRVEFLSERLYREVISSRLRPFSDGIYGFRRMVRDVARKLGKQVNFEVAGLDTLVDRDVLERIDSPLNHLLRNCLDHGVETPAERVAAGKPTQARIRLEAHHQGGMLVVVVSDDGRGISVRRLRESIVEKGFAKAELVKDLDTGEVLEFLFLPGFSTAGKVSELSGRGVGLDVVRTMVQDVGGSIEVRTKSGEGTSFHLRLPITRSVLRALLVEIAEEVYAFPLGQVGHAEVISVDALKTMENRQYFESDGRNVSLVSTRYLLDLEEGEGQREALPVVVLDGPGGWYGLEVDRFLGETELVVRPLDERLGKVANIQAVSLLEDGEVALILDIADMLNSISKHFSSRERAGRRKERETAGRGRARTATLPILVVDDSITVREAERRILENAGYSVDVAVDGVDGWNLLRSGRYCMVLTDVDMPRMTGLELVSRIRQTEGFENLPVMMVSYKDRDEDLERGLEAGADVYFAKSQFDDAALVRAVVSLVGEAAR